MWPFFFLHNYIDLISLKDKRYQTAAKMSLRGSLKDKPMPGLQESCPIGAFLRICPVADSYHSLK